LRKDQVARRKEKQLQRATVHRKKVEKEDATRNEKKREDRQTYMRAAGLKHKRDTEKEEGGARKRQRT